MWVGLIAGIFCGLYVVSRNFRHVVNIITIWVLKSLLWLFNKLDGTKEVQKTNQTSYKTTQAQSQEQLEPFTDDNLNEILKRKDIKITPIVK